MITYEQLTKNTTAFAKAKTTQPNIFKVGEKFAVLGTAGIYHVEVIAVGAGYSIDCTCTAGKHNKVCYHAAAALVAHLTEEAGKQRAKRMRTKPLGAEVIKFEGEAAAADAAAEREQERRDIEEAEARFCSGRSEYRTDYSTVLDDPRSADFHFAN